MNHLRRTAPAIAAVAFLTLSSCSDGPKLNPVSGTVLYLDQAAEGATVVFHPVGAGPESITPSGTVGPDGKFKLRTHPHGEGAPAGEYIVVITWFESESRELHNPRNRLPDRYALATASPLRATVNKGSNDLEPFRLTK